MTRLAVILVVVIVLPMLLYLGWTGIRPARPAAVVDKEIQTAARNNYLMLEEAMQLGLTEADAAGLVTLGDIQSRPALGPGGT